MTDHDAFLGLEPAGLWAHFSAIAGIARPSGRESAIADWIAGWAETRGFPVRRDSVGNICVSVPATEDMPGARVVALQAHLDMVCVRAENAASDPAAGKIEIVHDGEWIAASHSTLGADNGIGIAAAMSLAESKVIPHGPLELLFTVEEETTAKGADGLDPSLIQADVMLNLDAESSGVLMIGCAGSAWTVLHWPAPREPVPEDWRAVQIVLSGLRGGHSGLDIGKNRLNAIKGIVSVIRCVSESVPIRLCRLEGGDAFNAIPIRALAIIGFPGAMASECAGSILAAQSHLATRYSATDPELCTSQTTVDPRGLKSWSEGDGDRLLDLLSVVPSGVLALEQDAPDQVETSNNVGIVTERGDVIEVHSLARSSVASALEETLASIESAARLAGAEFTIIPPVVPPWRVAPDSAAQAVVQEAYRDLFGREPRLVTVHAATESAIILQRIPRLDIVSLGPEIQHAHMPGERVNIPSVIQFYDLICEVVMRLASSSVGGRVAGGSSVR